MRIRPIFKIKRNEDQSYSFIATITAASYLPLPINDEIEKYIIDQSTRDLDTYQVIINKKFADQQLQQQQQKE